MGGDRSLEIRIYSGCCPNERVGVGGEVGEEPGGEAAPAGDLNAGLPIFAGGERRDSFR